jgi:hypothetical protein
MVKVLLGFEVEKQRGFAVYPQRTGRQHCAFDTMGAVLPQNFAHCKASLTALLDILRDAVQEILNLHRRIQALQGAELHGTKSEILHCCGAFSH